MPLNYQSSFGRIGAGAGAGAGALAGGGLFGSLGRLMEPLDWARQAAWNVPNKIMEGDFLGAVPGLAGLVLGGGLAATGVGAPLAIGLGSVLGGGLQGAMRHYDDERFDAPSGSKFMQALGVDSDSLPGMAGGMAINALLDPLTYGGGALFKGLGSQIGGKLGGQYGKYAEEVARGQPLYPGSTMEPIAQAHSNAAEIAARVAQHGPGSYPDLPTLPEMPLRSPRSAANVAQRLDYMMNGPYGRALAQELPPGSQLTGHGREGFWFTVPGESGGVRIAGGPGALDLRTATGVAQEAAPYPRVQSQLMLQPERDVVHGPYRVEHLPSVDVPSVAASFGGQPATPLEAEMQHLIGHIDTEFRPGVVPHGLDEAARQRGMGTMDLGPLNSKGDPFVNPGNMGRTAEGNYLITDPGSLVSPNLADYPVRTPQPSSDWITRAILKRMNSHLDVQKELAEKMARGTAGQGLPLEEVRQLAKQWKPQVAVPADSLERSAWEEALRLNRDSAFGRIESMPPVNQVAALRQKLGIPEPGMNRQQFAEMLGMGDSGLSNSGLSHPPTVNVRQGGAPPPPALSSAHFPSSSDQELERLMFQGSVSKPPPEFQDIFAHLPPEDIERMTHMTPKAPIDPLTGQPLVNLMQGLNRNDMPLVDQFYKAGGLDGPFGFGRRQRFWWQKGLGGDLPYPLSGPG